MKKISLRVCVAALTVFTVFAIDASAQNVNVTGAVSGNGTYPDMGSAFTAINSGSQTGATIVVTVTGNTTEPVTATLNANTWATLSIMPSGGSGRTISGNIAGPLLDFSGADRVGVDGLNSGGNSLTIDNSNNTTGVSTIRLINDADQNAFQNLTILGAGASTTSGTVLFSNASSTGNDSITFNACTIGASGASFPTNGIYSAGTAVAGQENGTILINNCNIENYFNAGSITCGILVSTGNTDWTIQNCRLYQTALRTYTTANTHRGIQITSGNNHIVSANTIGYANSAGTGTYAMSGTIAVRFIAIDLAVGTSVASSVQGNTFTAFSLGTSSGAATTNGIVCGINVTSGNVNIGTVSPNIIGGSSGTNLISAVPTTSQGMAVGIHCSSTGTIVIQNNVIGGLTSSGPTAAVAGGVAGINISGVATSMTISGNTIGNTTADNMRSGTLGLTTGSSILSGINMTAIPSATIISNNTFQNLSSFGTGVNGYVRGIWTLASTSNAGVVTCTGNTFTNFSTNNTNTSISNAQAGTAGIAIGAGTNWMVSGNTITNLANTSTGGGQTFVVGVSHGNATNTTIANNQIYNLTNAGTSTSTTAPSIVAGVVIRSGTTGISVYNNMISLGSSSTTNTAIIGIMGNHGSTPDPACRVYNNTVNISGTVAAGAQPSFGIVRTDFSTVARTAAYDIRNNIVINTRTGGTGVHCAIGNNYGALTSTATGWPVNASNFNVLNASNPATVGWWTSAQTFSGWQAASASDASSLSGIAVTFVNPATDLHLNMGVTPTPLESGGTTIAMTALDIDAQNRPGPTGSVNGGAFGYDIGADEFDGVHLDIVAPTITYTPFLFTCATGDRTLTATIADFSGVPTAGILQPRIYYRKNANAWVSSQGVLTSGTGTNGTWDFPILAAAMGGIAQGDVISYFVIAQDIATPNITSNPSGGLAASDVNTVSTAPTTPSSYMIGGTLSGTYTVGVGGDYTTLTSAVADYNTSCFSGPVVFSLIDATYPSETFPITINANQNASAVNTLTIKPAVGVSPVITGSSATAIIILSGADYVTIDGSNSNTANSLCPRVQASRDLTISNTNTSTASAVFAMLTSASGDPATNNTLMNTNVTGNTSLSTGVAINISGTAIGSGAGSNFNSNNSIINNAVRQAQVGIFSAGASPTARNLNNVYNLNNLDFSGTAAIGRVGMMILYEDSPDIIANTVGNILNTASTDVIGISVGSNTTSNTLQASAEVVNATVTHNTVYELAQTNTFSCVGINFAATTTGTTLIADNTVNRVFCNGTASDFACGIYYGGGVGGTMNIYHNSVVVDGNTLTGASQPNAAIGINGATPNVDIRNNVLVCQGSNGFDGNTGIALAYTSTSGNYTNLTCDYNDIYVSGTSSGVGRTGGIGPGGIQRITLPNWQTETGRDANSVSQLPVFVSAADLHLVAGSNVGIEDAALPLAATLTDHDCVTRDLCSVDMGAMETGTPREIAVEGNAVAITDGDGTPSTLDFTDFDSTSVCNGTVTRVFTILNSGTTALNISGITFSGAAAADFTVSAAPASPVAPSGSTTFTVSFDPSAAGLRTAVVEVSSNDCDEALFDYAVQGIGTDITISGITTTDPLCAGSNDGTATSTVVGGMPVVTYAWSSGGTGPVETGLAGGTYTLVVTDANGCTASNVAILTEPSAVTNSTSQNDVLCNGGTGDATVTASGGAGGYTYAWSSGGTNAFESGLIAGTYTVIATDANGCSESSIVTITEPALLVAVVTTATGPTTCGGSDGMIDITVSGGTTAYTYSWSNANIVEDIVNEIAGTFSVVVTDANGCADTITGIVLNDPAAPVVTYSASIDTACQSTTAPFVLTGESPAGGTYSGPGVTGGIFDPATANLGMNVITYSFTDSLTGCSATAMDSIWVDICMGTSFTSVQAIDFSVYPNPNNGAFQLMLNTNSIADVQIFDAQGKMIFAEKMQPATTHTLNIESSGMYMITVITADGQRTSQRVVVNK